MWLWAQIHRATSADAEMAARKEDHVRRVGMRTLNTGTRVARSNQRRCLQADVQALAEVQEQAGAQAQKEVQVQGQNG